MKYACLIYDDGTDDTPLSDEEMDKLFTDSIAYHAEMQRKGQLLGIAALQGPETAAVVRRRNGKISTTDGPFVETKEQLGGLFLIEARDLNEAIRIAADHPAARWDTIEVRPLKELTQE